jgi:RNA-directed DNA polymerase
MQKTAAKRLRRVLGRFDDWCCDHRHDPLPAQRETLGKMLNEHYQYYGITGNFRSLQRLYRLVRRVWYKWLSRRSRKARKNWDWKDLRS